MKTTKALSGPQAFQRLAALCARGEHCQHEMLEKMRQWGVSDEEQASVMQKLIEGRYVDDERYARAFVNDKIRYSKWGRRKVEQGLWLKHIDSETIAQVLDDVDDSEYIDILKPLLKQKAAAAGGLQSGGNHQHSLLRAKLIKFALGRGFTMDIIRQCIDVDDEDEFLD